MKTKYFTLLLAIYSYSVLAQELPPDRTIFFEKNLFLQPELFVKPVAKDLFLAPNLSENSSLEEKINHAIVSKNWQLLEILLKEYRNSPDYDSILYDYGLGALYRYKGEQDKAIQIYKKIINLQPDLHYPHFDLAMMLFEDKRFNAAEAEFNSVYPFMSPQVQVLIDQLLVQIKKEQAWSPVFNLSFEKTNNVNQSSNIREITIGEAIFIRDKESLPQKAQGIGYQLGITREKNIINNHYNYVGLQLNGINYWDNTEYSEQTIRADIGYKYKDIKQSWGVIPFIEKNLLGQSSYSLNYGAGFIYSYKLLNQLQVLTSFNYIQKSYRDNDLAKHYDGYTNSQSILLIYQSSSNLLTYGGLDWIDDQLKDKSESSKRNGIRGGLIYLNNYLSIDTNLRYGKRRFSADNIWYSERRKDDEYQFNISLWNKQFQWKNFIPKINYSYQKIDSNLALYKRDNGSWFISIDRDF